MVAFIGFFLMNYAGVILPVSLYFIAMRQAKRDESWKSKILL